MVWPAGCGPDARDGDQFAVTVTWRGEGRYSVDRGRAQLSRAGNWAFSVPRFKRHQYRFGSFEEAQDWARLVVDDVQLAGRTWSQWVKHWADLDAATAVAMAPASTA